MDGGGGGDGGQKSWQEGCLKTGHAFGGRHYCTALWLAKTFPILDLCSRGSRRVCWTDELNNVLIKVV